MQLIFDHPWTKGTSIKTQQRAEQSYYNTFGLAELSDDTLMCG